MSVPSAFALILPLPRRRSGRQRRRSTAHCSVRAERSTRGFPSAAQQTTLRALGDQRVRAIVERYLDAWERGDVDAIAATLAEDATFAMPPYSSWWRGSAVIAAFAAEPVHRYLPTRSNGQPANAAYRWSAERGEYVAEALEVPTLEGDRVRAMTAFMSPEVVPLFGLPETLRRNA